MYPESKVIKNAFDRHRYLFWERERFQLQRDLRELRRKQAHLKRTNEKLKDWLLVALLTNLVFVLAAVYGAVQ